MDNLAERILAYRKKYVLTIKRFGELCKVSECTIWNIEHGKAHPSFLTRARIEKVLNADVNKE